jgi:hypothetical protein
MYGTVIFISFIILAMCAQTEFLKKRQALVLRRTGRYQ